MFALFEGMKDDGSFHPKTMGILEQSRANYLQGAAAVAGTND
ncbi:hypothetical protein AB4Z50_13995 [Paenibacillus sp. 2TAB26]